MLATGWLYVLSLHCCFKIIFYTLLSTVVRIQVRLCTKLKNKYANIQMKFSLPELVSKKNVLYLFYLFLKEILEKTRPFFARLTFCKTCCTNFSSFSAVIIFHFPTIRASETKKYKKWKQNKKVFFFRKNVSEKFEAAHFLMLCLFLLGKEEKLYLRKRFVFPQNTVFRWSQLICILAF